MCAQGGLDDAAASLDGAPIGFLVECDLGYPTTDFSGWIDDADSAFRESIRGEYDRPQIRQVADTDHRIFFHEWALRLLIAEKGCELPVRVSTAEFVRNFAIDGKEMAVAD